MSLHCAFCNRPPLIGASQAAITRPARSPFEDKYSSPIQKPNFVSAIIYVLHGTTGTWVQLFPNFPGVENPNLDTNMGSQHGRAEISLTLGIIGSG